MFFLIFIDYFSKRNLANKNYYTKKSYFSIKIDVHMANFKGQKFKFYIIKLIISAFAVLITAWLLTGVKIGEPVFINSLLIALVLSFLNSFLKPVLILLTIRVTIYTFGLFLLVINALIILLASEFIDGFEVDGFLPAIAFSIILSIVTAILDAFGKIKIVQNKTIEKNEQ